MSPKFNQILVEKSKILSRERVQRRKSARIYFNNAVSKLDIKRLFSIKNSVNRLSRRLESLKRKKVDPRLINGANIKLIERENYYNAVLNSILKKVARNNSAKKFGNNWVSRSALALKLRDSRKKVDRLWRLPIFDMEILEMNTFFKVDLIDEINKLQRKHPERKLDVLEVAVGKGKVARAIKDFEKNNVNVSANGVAFHKEWKNQNDINWSVGVPNKLEKKFGPNSLDFIYSHSGFIYSTPAEYANIYSSISYLRPGGRILFTGYARSGLVPVPKGFKEIRPPVESVSEKRKLKGIIYYWEKI